MYIKMFLYNRVRLKNVMGNIKNVKVNNKLVRLNLKNTLKEIKAFLGLQQNYKGTAVYQNLFCLVWCFLSVLINIMLIAVLFIT